MAILHKNISAEGDIHNPKWFSGANNGDVAWRNELGVLESTDELVLPAALDFVDGSAAPPTSNSGDIYVLSSGASVNAGWGTVSLGDWVRYDGTTWNVITPQKSSLCYNETTDALNSYDGSTWSAIGGGGTDVNAVHVNSPSEISGITAKPTPTTSDLLIIEDVADSNNKKKITIGDLPSSGGGGNTIYTADDTIGTGRVATLTDTLTFKNGTVNVQGAGTSTGSALAIYDNDTTPKKLWDFLDNGNINLGVDSVLNIGAKDLDINGSGLFSVSNGARSISTSWNTHTIFNLNNGNGTIYSLYSGNSSSIFNAGEFGIGVGSNIPIKIFNGSSVALGNVTKGNLDTNYNVQTNGSALIGGTLDTKSGTNEISLDHNNYPKLKISNGTQEYWLIEGDGTGATFASGEMYLYDATNARKLIHFLSDGNIDFPNIPTSAPTKGIWNDGGTLKIA